uniref:SHC-transforming protein 1-like n=1 Tax=Phascolarctos cinereus TaxID=38626 RepID=A0A6P5JBL4_PHACI|nr:SHC-transforming protein 1-like [Phascolarctos cinereus]
MSSVPLAKPLRCASNNTSGTHPSLSLPMTAWLALVAQFGMRRKRSRLTVGRTMTSQGRSPPPWWLSRHEASGWSWPRGRPPPPSTQTTNHLRATLPVGQLAGGDPDIRKRLLTPGPGRELFGDPSYVNVQNLEKVRQGAGGPSNPTTNGSVPGDLFDMKPFEDALLVPPPVPTTPMAEQLRGQPWFRGKLGRREAEGQLRLNGDFLVRESKTAPGQYVVTGLQSRQSKCLLLLDPEGVVQTKDHRFESVNHLISYHLDNHLPIISAGSELRLQQQGKLIVKHVPSCP